MSPTTFIYVFAVSFCLYRDTFKKTIRDCFCNPFYSRCKALTRAAGTPLTLSLQVKFLFPTLYPALSPLFQFLGARRQRQRFTVRKHTVLSILSKRSSRIRLEAPVNIRRLTNWGNSLTTLENQPSPRSGHTPMWASPRSCRQFLLLKFWVQDWKPGFSCGKMLWLFEYNNWTLITDKYNSGILFYNQPYKYHDKHKDNHNDVRKKNVILTEALSFE